MMGNPCQKQAYLLPNYDEYAIAYKDRYAFVDPAYNKFLDTRGAAIFSHMLFVQGKIIGLWRRTVKKDTVEIEIKPFRKFSQAESAAVTEAIEKYGAFLNLKPILRK